MNDTRQAGFTRLWSAGRASWPNLALDEATFSAWADEHVPTDASFDKLDGPGLYLVASALLGVPGAVRAFIEGPLAAAGSSLARTLPTPEARAEHLHELSVHLLTPGEDEDAWLERYDGRAPLSAWIRIIAVRRALNKTRGKTRLVDLEEATLDQASAHDPEVSVLRRLHRDDITAILRDAILALGPEDRAILRLRFAEGATLAALATLQKSSVTTMHRRLDALHEGLMKRVTKLMRERLRLSASQQGSMIRIFQSDLRDALGRFLRGSE